MAQAEEQCFQAISACAFRATALNADGTVADGPNNSYVTNNIMKVGYSPQIEEGEERVLKNSCGCLIGRKRERNTLKGIDLSLDLAQIEPSLMSLLTGAPLIVDDSASPVAIGFGWPSVFGLCDPDDQQPPVAVEFWQQLWDGSAQASGAYSYLRHVYPRTLWSFDDGEANEDFATFSLTAFSEGNPNWEDVYTDWPAGVILPEMGAVFYDTAPPVAECSLQTVGS